MGFDRSDLEGGLSTADLSEDVDIRLPTLEVGAEGFGRTILEGGVSTADLSVDVDICLPTPPL